MYSDTDHCARLSDSTKFEDILDFLLLFQVPQQTTAFQPKAVSLTTPVYNAPLQQVSDSFTSGKPSLKEPTSYTQQYRTGEKRTYEEACLDAPTTLSSWGQPTVAKGDLTQCVRSPFATVSGTLLPCPQTKFLRPLYCKVCRVTLNAPAQAKQHYEGKSHARRVKMNSTGSEEDASNGDTDETGRASANSTSSGRASSGPESLISEGSEDSGINMGAKEEEKDGRKDVTEKREEKNEYKSDTKKVRLLL